MSRDAAGDDTRAKHSRGTAQIASLDALVGAHPDALSDFYAAGRACDPTTMTIQRGVVLAFQPLAPAHALTRPLVTAIVRHLMPWRGKAFESGGTAGANLFYGGKSLRFHGEVIASALDGRPTFSMKYDGLGNPWPAANVIEELREVGPGTHVGPLLWRGSDGSTKPLLWLGLESHQ